MLIVGLVLLVAAAVAGGFALRARAQLRHTADAEALTTAELGTRSADSQAFRQHCAVVGRAAPADGQVGSAPDSQTPAVWHRVQVTRRYWEMERRERNGKTDWERVERTETVSDHSSELPFAVEDDGGRVLVAPAGASIDHPEKTVDRFDRGDGGAAGGVVESVLGAALGGRGAQSGTIGLQTEEWVVRPGTDLYVVGEVAHEHGHLRFAKARGVRLVVSTRSATEVAGSYRRNALIATVIGGVLAVAGLATVVAGLAG